MGSLTAPSLPDLRIVCVYVSRAAPLFPPTRDKICAYPPFFLFCSCPGAQPLPFVPEGPSGFCEKVASSAKTVIFLFSSLFCFSLLLRLVTAALTPRALWAVLFSAISSPAISRRWPFFPSGESEGFLPLLSSLRCFDPARAPGQSTMMFFPSAKTRPDSSRPRPYQCLIIPPSTSELSYLYPLAAGLLSDPLHDSPFSFLNILFPLFSPVLQPRRQAFDSQSDSARVYFFSALSS